MDPPGFGRALKRMADEDVEDLRAVSEASEHLTEARKRLKSRQYVRDEFLFSDMPLNDFLSSANAAGDGFGTQLDPFDSVSRASSIELGRDLSGDNRSDPSLHVQDPFKSLADLLDEFRDAYSDGDENFLWCAACHELPDDPILTSCLHLYCLECFTEILVEAKEDSMRPACEAGGCEGFTIPHGFYQLSPAQFHILAQSIGITVHDPAGQKVVRFSRLSTFDMFSAVPGIVDAISSTDDVDALTTAILSPELQQFDQVLEYDRASMPLSDKVVESAVKAHREELLDGLHDSDDEWDLYMPGGRFPKARSEGYATSNEDDNESDDDSISDDPAEHPFINDGPIPKAAKYILDSDSDSASSTDSDSDSGEYDSDDSDISATESQPSRRSSSVVPDLITMDGGVSLEHPSGLGTLEEKDAQDSDDFQEDSDDFQEDPVSSSLFAPESGAGTKEEPVVLSDE